MTTYIIALTLFLSCLSTTMIHAEPVAAQEFYNAARAGDESRLSQLLKAEPSLLNAKDGKGYTALIYSAYHGEAKAVNFLLKQGADPCVQDNNGNTATLGAIFKGHLGIVKTLLKAPCTKQEKNFAGQTPLMFAALFGRSDIAKELIHSGADPEVKDLEGRKAEDLAKGQFNEEMVKILEGKKTK